MNLNISTRLETIAGIVTCHNSVADIGTDHGYIPIYLAKKGISDRIIALDVNEGPLKKAEENIKLYSVQDKVSTRLSNGFENLLPGETDTVIIAGMGALLINSILKEGLNKAHSAKELILCPHCDVERTRLFLYENNFAIRDEFMVKEDGKYYFILKADTGRMEKPEDEYLYYGRPLLERCDMTLLEYLKKELALCRIIKENILTNGNGDNTRLMEICHKEECIQRGLSMYEIRRNS